MLLELNWLPIHHRINFELATITQRYVPPSSCPVYHHSYTFIFQDPHTLYVPPVIILFTPRRLAFCNVFSAFQLRLIWNSDHISIYILLTLSTHSDSWFNLRIFCNIYFYYY